MDLGSIHACVSACDARYGERGGGWGSACGPDLHLRSFDSYSRSRFFILYKEFFSYRPVGFCTSYWKSFKRNTTRLSNHAGFYISL